MLKKPSKKRKVNKTSLTKRLDAAWSLEVKRRAGYRCEVCGKRNNLNSHHIVGRRNRNLRWDLRNGVCLCVSHHKFGLQSFHEDPLWAREWLEENRWEDLQFIMCKRNEIVKWTIESMQSKLKELTND